jgi:hypothetical protein
MLAQHPILRLTVIAVCVASLAQSAPALPGDAQQTPPALGTWVQAQPTLSPVGRAGAGLAALPDSKSMLLFGGQDAARHTLDDTWAWNGVLQTWTQRQPAERPHARCCTGMAYDAQTATVVLFGGSDSAGHALQDTWTWDGTNWTPVSSVGGPGARSGVSMVYDETRRVVVLFGGLDQNGNLLSDTWTWDGVSWNRQQPADSPPARTEAAFAFDSFSKTAVLFGGCCSSGVDLRAGPFLGDTWVWDGANWTLQQPTASPPARSGAALAYDPILASMLLFGGCSGLTDCRLADSWLWDGSNWTAQQAPNHPSGRTQAALATDAATNTILLVGGLQQGAAGGDTYGADTRTWIGQLPAGQPAAAPGG